MSRINKDRKKCPPHPPTCIFLNCIITISDNGLMGQIKRVHIFVCNMGLSESKLSFVPFKSHIFEGKLKDYIFWTLAPLLEFYNSSLIFFFNGNIDFGTFNFIDENNSIKVPTLQ